MKENTLEEKFSIKDAQPEDVEKIRAIARAAWIKLYPNEKFGITRGDIEAIGWFNPEQIEKRRKRILENTNFHAWVLKDKDNNVIGFCQATKEERQEHQGEIEAMYVVPEFQGKGFGKKLMDCALYWLGLDKDIILEVVSYNKNAIDFYKKCGFKETALLPSEKRTQLPSGKLIPRIVMLKSQSTP